MKKQKSKAEMPENLPNLNIVLFDGVCNFCNGTINFLMDQDKKLKLKFAPLQSQTGQELLKKHDLPTEDFESFVYISSGRVFRKSTAALHIAKTLGGAWTLLFGLIIIPAIIRNALYSLIARNRYRWFGEERSLSPPLSRRAF